MVEVNGTYSGKVPLSPGVYNLSFWVEALDRAGNITKTEAITLIIAVYDPTGGFVTGGGWIMSPPGAYAQDPSMTGKASFGLVSKYQKGATIPTGNTEFQFHAAGLNFKSRNG